MGGGRGGPRLVGPAAVRLGGRLGLPRDPGRQDVVGVLGGVVADEGVEQVGVAAHVRLGQYDELTLARRGGQGGRTGQEGGVAGQHRGGGEQRGGVGGRSLGEHEGRRFGA